jgi:hypothetical protein
VICRIEAFAQKLYLCVEMFDMAVKVLERSVSEEREVKSVFLTSSVKLAISLEMCVVTGTVLLRKAFEV